VLNSIGIDYTKFFLLEANLAMIVSIISLIVIVVCILLAARMRLSEVQIAKPATRWTLPRIEDPKP
jgi:heme/copper-type cytochrome/quinol oxidase subunit 2